MSAKENINISSTVVGKILRRCFLLSPKATRLTKKSTKRELERLKKLAAEKSCKERPFSAELQKRLLALSEAHPSRPRKKYFGELLQTDASEHLWFGENKTALHLAVDDASGRIVGAYFDTHETLYGYFKMSEQIFLTHGIPAAFLADNRTIFIYNTKKNLENDEGNDRKTQFSYMCKNLGIEIRTTSVAQAKGRVERMWDTLQNRLPLEMRLAGISSIDKANEFLKSYIPEFNKKFAIDLPKHLSVFVQAPPKGDLKLYLSHLSERKTDNGSSVRYKNKTYAIFDNSKTRIFLRRNTAGTIAHTLTGELYFTVETTTYALAEIPTHEPRSKNFDISPKPPITPSSSTRPDRLTQPLFFPCVPKIPKKNTPWLPELYKNFKNSQKTSSNKVKNA